MIFQYCKNQHSYTYNYYSILVFKIFAKNSCYSYIEFCLYAHNIVY